jgi:hypothetical protein
VDIRSSHVQQLTAMGSLSAEAADTLHLQARGRASRQPGAKLGGPLPAAATTTQPTLKVTGLPLPLLLEVLVHPHEPTTASPAHLVKVGH